MAHSRCPRHLAIKIPFWVRNQTLRRALCLILIPPLVGCAGTYRIQCTSDPGAAEVLAGGQSRGTTPCTLKIPENSDLIRDKRIELTFRLPDGREEIAVAYLTLFQPRDPLSVTGRGIGAVVASVGILCIYIWGKANLERIDSDNDSSDSDSEDHDGLHEVGLFGLGCLLGGGLLFSLCGGDVESLGGSSTPVHVVFGGLRDPNTLGPGPRP